jgi:xanthine dehydrogenase iron-sulfur cluster and FAD-binding subunit A
MTLYDLHRRGVVLSETELHEELAGNLCRCTGYEGILAAGRVLLGVEEPNETERET